MLLGYESVAHQFLCEQFLLSAPRGVALYANALLPFKPYCDTTTVRLRHDYDVSRAPASIRRDSTRTKNEHVNFSS